MADTEQKALIEAILHGDSNAYRQFIEEYKNLVAHVVFQLISNPTDREDICQEVFVSAYQHLKDFQHQSKISTWLARIAYFRCLNYLKKRRALLFDDHTPEEVTFDDVASSSFDPYEETEKNERLTLVREAIAQMPIVYRTILTLYHLQEMSYQEIGKVMGLPPGTVKSYLFRARTLLRQRLTAVNQEEDVW
jgi:RNA polymerase sigma-70 factor (ECF subfamily)